MTHQKLVTVMGIPMTHQALVVLMVVSVALTLLFMFLGAVLDYFVLGVGTDKGPDKASSRFTFEMPMYILAAVCFVAALVLYTKAWHVWHHNHHIGWLVAMTFTSLGLVIVMALLIWDERLLPMDGRMGYRTRTRRSFGRWRQGF